VNEAAVLPLHAWETFYVIVGSCAGALIGLQFVVMTLIASEGAPGSRDAVSAYGSPTVVHFCVALLISAALSAPWKGAGAPGFVLTACGIGGLAYAITIFRRARQQRSYQPVFEDWLWHSALPAVAYGTLLIAGILLAVSPMATLFAIAGATLLLVFIGIHNAWDTIMYITIEEFPDAASATTGAAAGDGGTAPVSGATLDAGKGPPSTGGSG
jgi:hypothetical protein